MFATIVVGTDGSQTARRAMTVAAELSRSFGATLHVVHASIDPTAGSGMHDASSRWHDASASVLEDALADPALEGLETIGHVVAAAPHEAILEIAEAKGADLIVVGNRGFSAPGGRPESVPEQVARRAPCHVLIAKTT